MPLDGSEFAEAALPWALSLADASEGVVELVMVWDPFQAFPEFIPEVTAERGTTWATSYLDDLRERLRDTAASVPTLEAQVLRGRTADTLAEHIGRSGADLAVLSTHGRGAFSRFWLGSVAQDLIRRSPIPLLLARPTQWESVDLRWRPRLDHILVPLGEPADADTILEHAAALGTPWGARYTLLRVLWRYREGLVGWSVEPLASAETDLKARTRRADDELEAVAEVLDARDLEATPQVVQDDHPASGILRVAQEGQVDAIAMATHGRGPMGRALMGSVADKVVRGATVPVLLHRPAAPD